MGYCHLSPNKNTSQVVRCDIYLVRKYMWVITARSAKKQKCIGSVSLLSRNRPLPSSLPVFLRKELQPRFRSGRTRGETVPPTATVARNEKTLGASPPSLPRSSAGNSGWSQGETPLDSGRGLGGVRVMLCMKRWTYSPRRHFCDFCAWTISGRKSEKSNRLTILRTLTTFAAIAKRWRIFPQSH